MIRRPVALLFITGSLIVLGSSSVPTQSGGPLVCIGHVPGCPDTDYVFTGLAFDPEALLMAPLINNNGHVAYLAQLAVGPRMVLHKGGTLITTPVQAGAIDFNDNGDILTLTAAGTSFQGVPLRLSVFEESIGSRDVATSGFGEFFSLVASLWNNNITIHSFNNSRDVAFFAEEWSHVSGIRVRRPGDPSASRLIAHTSGPFSGFETGASRAWINPSINDLGDVAFFARTDTGQIGIFVGRGGEQSVGDYRSIAPNSALPGWEGSPLSINNSGEVAYRTVMPNAAAIVVGNGQSVRTVADTASGAFVGFDPFGPLTLNDVGTVAFLAYLPSTSTAGIFVGPHPAHDKVIYPGDQLFGRTVSSVHLSSRPLNNHGQLAFVVRFTDGGGAVVRADPLAGDTDRDSVPDATDNCRLDVNPDQLDSDGDSIGDVCDPNSNDGPAGDIDRDGISNQGDLCPATPQGDPVDVTGCSPLQSSPPGEKELIPNDPLIDTSRPTIVLTHGLQESSAFADAPDSLWTGFRNPADGHVDPRKATSLIANVTGQQVNIVRYVWRDAFRVDGIPNRVDYYRAARHAKDAGADLAQRLLRLVGANYDRPIHFVGHSLGTVVNAYAANGFLKAAAQISIAQFTSLDRPHHVNDIPRPDGTQTSVACERHISDNPEFFLDLTSTEVFSICSDHFEQTSGYDDTFFAQLLQNVRSGLTIKIDNYFAVDGIGAGVGDVARGAVYNHNEAPADAMRGLVEPNDVGGGLFEGEAAFGIDNNHSGVQQWYRWTTEPNNVVFTVENGGDNFCDSQSQRVVNNWPSSFDESLDPCRSGWYWAIAGPNSSSWPAAFPTDNGGSVSVASVDVQLNNVQTHGCTISTGFVITCVEQSSPSLAATVQLPAHARSIEFEYRFANPGDGDYAVVFLDNVPIWTGAGSSFIGDRFQDSAPIPVPEFAGMRTLRLVLYGVGIANAEFELRGLRAVLVNVAPVANAGSDQTVEATSPSGTSVMLDGSTSSDPDGDPLTHVWVGPFGTQSGAAVNVTIPLGTHVVTLTVDDGRGGTSSDPVSVTVQDTVAPVVTPPQSISIVATQLGGATASGSSALAAFLAGSSASDAVDSNPVRLTPMVAGAPITNVLVFPLGQTQVTFSFKDSSSNIGSATAMVTVTAPRPIVCDVDLDLDVDVNDLAIIRAANGQRVGSSDPRDGNGDGSINVADMRYCQLRCTRPSCVQ